MCYLFYWLTSRSIQTTMLPCSTFSPSYLVSWVCKDLMRSFSYCLKLSWLAWWCLAPKCTRLELETDCSSYPPKKMKSKTFWLRWLMAGANTVISFWNTIDSSRVLSLKTQDLWRYSSCQSWRAKSQTNFSNLVSSQETVTQMRMRIQKRIVVQRLGLV